MTVTIAKNLYRSVSAKSVSIKRQSYRSNVSNNILNLNYLLDESIDCACCKQKFLVNNFITPKGGGKARQALRKQITDEKNKAEAKTAKNRKKR